MSFFGTRRPRQARVFRPAPTLRDRFQAALRDHRILSRVMIATTAVVLMLLSTQAWRTRFPYRSGQFVATGIQSRAGFEVENVFETEAGRNEAANAAPLVLIQDNTVIDRLSSQLRDQLSEIANARTAEQLSERTRHAFALDGEDPLARESRFGSIRKPLISESESVGTRLDAIVRQFDGLMAEPRQLGMIDRESALRMFGKQATEEDLDAGRERSVMVVDADGKLVGHCVLGYVLLEQQLGEAGRLAHKWDTLPDLAEIREPIEHWLQDTFRNQLRLDPRATEQERLKAQTESPVQFDAYPEGTVLIPAGTQLDFAKEMNLLNQEYEEFEKQRTFGQRLTHILSNASMVLMLVLLFGTFLKYSYPQLLAEPSRLLTFVLLCAGTVLLSTNLSRDPWRAEIVPLLATVLISSIAFNQVVAILTALCLAFLISMASVGDLGHFITLVVICVSAVIPLQRIRTRFTLIQTGAMVAVIAFIATWGIGVIQAQGSPDAWKNTAILGLAVRVSGGSLLCCV
ncbi:MAG: hypothetical protein KDA96_09125, partial [Planctomycetaceae bacterium]|nr:hypothetical protein [Planctomycetaceae bacterium]